MTKLFRFIANFFVFFGVGFGILFTGCGENQDSVPDNLEPSLLPITHKPDAGSCLFSPYEGPNLASLQNKTWDDSSDFFNKSLSESQFLKVMNSSGQVAWNFIRSQGIATYKVADSANSPCQYFTALPNAPQKISANWRKQSQNGSRLLGLFTSTLVKDINTGKVTLKAPSITLRSDAERWTLLHEYLHFLFASKRAETLHLPFQEELIVELRKLAETIDSEKNRFQNQPTEKNSLDLIVSWKKFFQTSYELNRRGLLEEFAIEGYLLNLYKENQLLNINENRMLPNAQNYMIFSVFNAPGNKGLSLYDQYASLFRKINKFKKNQLAPNWNEAHQLITETLTEIADLLDFIERELDKAKAIVEGPQPSPAPLSRNFFPGQSLTNETTGTPQGIPALENPLHKPVLHVDFQQVLEIQSLFERI